MYKLALILKYLRKRRIAWVSLIAVMLCTTMVLVVISVMGGWLRMFRASFRGLSGDVIVQAQHPSGFPYYQTMIDRIEALPEVGPGGAVPVIESFGLVNIGDIKGQGVQVLGYPIDKIGNVNDFPRSLYRQHNRYLEIADDPNADLTDAERQEFRAAADRALDRPSFDLLPDVDYKRALQRMYPNALPRAVENAPNWPGMIAGTGVLNIRKDATGQIVGRSDFLYEIPVRLTTLAIGPGRSIDLANKADLDFWIVDDSRTKVWQYDSQTVYVPFDVLQRMLQMEPRTGTDPQTGKPIEQPGRTSEINVRVLPEYDLNATKVKIQQIVEAVLAEQIAAGAPLHAASMPDVQTWEETQALYLNAIEKEKALVTFLFAIISVVAIFLIFCIFYMIVVEKTKDIGIIKSVGATSAGVAGIFLGYGMAIGLVGGGLGLLLGYLIVSNINYLHQKLGEFMGIQVWDPQIYAFDTIPNTMDPKEVAVIVGVAIVASILGALVPAIRAARMHPIESLRYE